MKTTHYFAGANTARGFYSRFEDILPEAQRKRVYYIKGGPGVGKSTLMRRVGEAAEGAGHDVEYFHCSSDPDSLDGVSIPSLGAALMDGTAPHVYDPRIPGARDTLLSLGDFLDDPALRPRIKEIDELMKAISERFRRCYCYLAAAADIARAAPICVESTAKELVLVDQLAADMPLRGGSGSIRRLFASAYTPKGWVDYKEAFARTYTVACPAGAHADGLTRMLCERAQARGLNVIALLDPLTPEHISRVAIPAHGIAYQIGSERDGSDILSADSVFDTLPANDERERGFDQNARDLLLQRGVEQLRAAKTLHDELESIYTSCMDYLKWQDVLKEVLTALELPSSEND